MSIVGTIFEVKRFAVHDGAGIRTSVFLKGCPLNCIWCHNPEGISAKPQLAFYENKCVSCSSCVERCEQNAHQMMQGNHIFNRNLCTACGRCETQCPQTALVLYGKRMTVEELLPQLLEDREFYEASGGGVTLSGGECLMQPEFCAALLRELKQQGIHTAVDTCGFVSKAALDQVMPYTDVFLYDLKAYDEQVHIRCTGQSNQKILENLRYIDDCGKTSEIRIPFVPEYNKEEIPMLADFVRTLNHVTAVKILPYHNYAGSKYTALGMQHTLPSALPTLEELRWAEMVF